MINKFKTNYPKLDRYDKVYIVLGIICMIAFVVIEFINIIPILCGIYIGMYTQELLSG